MRFVVHLISGKYVVFPEGYAPYIGKKGSLDILKQSTGEWLKTYSPHAWEYYEEWKEQ